MKHVKTIRERYTLQLIKFPIDCRRIEAFYATQGVVIVFSRGQAVSAVDSS